MCLKGGVNMKLELIEKLTVIYIEKNIDSVKTPEELVDLYWETFEKIKKYKSPSEPSKKAQFIDY